MAALYEAALVVRQARTPPRPLSRCSRPSLARSLSQGDWRELRYHGDWMLRPIASNEVAPLVRVLVRISCAVNSVLQLSRTPTPPGEEPPETVRQVRARAPSSQAAGC